MIRAAVLAVLLVPAAVIGLDTPLVMADSHMPEDAFVTTWRVTNNDKIIKIPVGGQMGNYTVDWGDGTDSTTHVSDATHTYSTAGDYTVSISGDFKKIFLNGVQSSSVSEVKNAKQLRSIEQWGDMEWSSMTSAFRGAFKMTYNATDTPDLSNVKSMEYMFHAARAFNGNLSSWNVSQVTNMGFMYQNARAFNGDISSWNVSKVTNMQAMFASADAFNQPLNRWDVSQVTNMDGMFNDASSFNGDISIWNVSAVTDMNSMFNGASSFNGDISIWNVSAVTDMSSMFNGASSFNGDISRWNVSAVTDMSSMFNGASSSSSFNGDISIWNVSAVTDMSSMFDGASSFNGDISRWNVSAVTDMNNMFNGVSSFNQTLNDWDVLKVTDMSYMFSGAEVFNQPLNDWDVSKVNNTYGMFEFASSFNGNISSWNVSAVTNMNSMFSDASSFNQTLNDWDVLKVTDMSYMFLGAAAFNQPLNGWDVSKVTNMNSMFEYASSFNQPLNDWDVSKVTDMYYMFSSAAAFNQPLNNWNVSKVTDMDNMFSSAAAFNQPLNNWNVSAVTSMRSMFSGASSFEQNLGKWYVVPADTVYNTSDEMSLVITTIAAQNSVLDGHSHYYGIGTGGNSTLFNMTDSNLVFNATPSAGIYMVNVTAPDGDFGTNNHHVFDITVEGQDDSTVSADAFLTTWNVTASPYTISIPVEVHTGGTLTIDWGDTTTTTVNTNGTQSHTYSASDEYQVSMTGDLSRIILGNLGSTSSNLASIDQWGDIEWSSMEGAFRGASNMEYKAADAPDLSHVTSMQNMFRDASSFNGNLSDWNVLTVTNMDGTFRGASDFNGDVSSWDTSSATDMRNMFQDADNFDGDISGWDVSKVTDTSSMFYEASDFNQPLNGWDVSKVTDMSFMFDDADSFNQPLNGWDVSKVTDMSFMFFGTAFFDGDLTGWDVSKVTDMSSMFDSADSFNQPLNGWDVSSVTEMNSMFASADSFNRPLNSWNVSAVTDMFAMFRSTDFFDGDISGWDVSKVTDMSRMFSGAFSFNGDISGWDVSKVTNMDSMFSSVTDFKQNLGKWYVVPADTDYNAATETTLVVTAIAAQNFVLDGHIPNYGIGTGGDFALFNMTGNNLVFKSTPPSAGTYTVNVTAPGGTFGTNNHRILDVTVTGQEGRPLLVVAGPDQRVLDESAVTLSGTVSDSDSTDLTYLWTQNPGSPAVTLTGSDTLMPTFTAPDVSSDVDLVFTLRVDDGPDTVTDTVTVTVHDAEADFVTTWSDITVGINLPIRNSTGSFTVDWGDGEITEYATIATDTSLTHLYDIHGTYTIRISGNFSGIYLQDKPSTTGKLQSIDQWGDIEWTTMAGAFYGAVNMIYNATDVPDLSSVTDMSYMFFNTPGFSSGDLSGWNVSGVTDMRTMFAFSGYTGVLSGWDVSSVTYMQNMFSRASSFDSDLSGWDVSAVTDMDGMFFDATFFDSDLSGWNVSSVTTMQNMFFNAASFNSDLSGWNVSAVNNMDDMFSGASSFEQNLGPWYIVLDSDTISYPTQTLEIMAQNSFLDGQDPMYGLGAEGLFVVDADAGTLGLDPNSDPPPNGIYQVSVTSTGIFGTANHHTVSVRVNNADPAVTPPTFDSSELNTVTRVLRITFSETIDVTPATNIVPTKIHIRELGNYTGGITLSADELGTTSDDATISFNLNVSRLAAVAVLTTPELTIEPGAVQDTFGNLIDGTFDVSTAVFVNATSVSSQDTKPYGIAFSNNGTKMFVVGDYYDNINQYALLTPFDISTASYGGNGERFSALQDTSPRGMAFSNDGLKMFVVGDTNNNINQYALSSPFDVSTANFTTATLTPDRFPKGMAFSNDGLKMFVVSSGEDAIINQYALSSPFDLFNATFVASPLDISEQDTYPKDMAFSNDGTKMFVVGSRGEAVNEYTLSPAFDVSTANFTTAISITSQDGDPAGMTFSNDGAKMFVVGDHGNDVNEYALSSVYPITVNNTVAPDTTPPTLSLTGNTSVTISVGTTYNDEGATCEDAVDGTIIPTVVSNTVDTTQTGTYAVTYSCTDAANNPAIQVTRTVTVEAAPDTTPPTLSLTGNTSVTISVGTTYNDEGATCEDAVDGTIIPTVVSNTVDTTQTGTYAVTYSCTDAANNPAIQVTRTVTVEAAPDTTPPTLSLTGNTSVTISVGTTYNDEGATCEDAVDGTIIPTVVSNTVDTTQTGTYAVTYSCTDAANNPAIQVTRTVTVEAAPDTTPPTLSLTGNTSVTISVGTTYNDEGATCEDAVDGTIIPTVVSNTVDTTQTGTYAVTYSCTDAANNPATQVSRTVIVQTAVTPDTTPPTLSLTGNTSVTISVGTTYNDEGATCEDAVDGTIIPTVVSNTVDTTQTGTYAVTYSCTDAANNPAIQVTRTVTVEAAPDTTPPTLSLTGNTSVTISVGTTYNDEGATCEDAVDGTIIPTVVSNTVDTTQTGTYAVTYSCTDAANNPATQVSRTVIVQTAVTPDTTPPTLSLTGNTSVTISVGTTYNDEGATCEDAVDGTIIPTVVSNTVDTTQTGTYAVTYSCTDAANNPAIQVTRTVTVEAAPDTTPPTLSLTGNTSVTISVGTTYNDEGATCEDAVDGTIIPTVVSNTVDTTQTGTYAVTYSCTDAANNPATQVSRTVIVQTAVTPDTTPPTLSLTGNTSVTISVGTTYNDEGATCEDAVDGTIIPTVVSNTVDTTQTGTYAVTYSCTDAAGNDAIPVDRIVTVTDRANTAPVAEAGPHLQVDEGKFIILRGSGSDVDNDVLTYSWSQDSRLSFDNRTSATPTVTASSVTIDTPITLTLTVDDGTTFNEDTMILTILEVTSDNLRPTVSVGSGQTVKEGVQVSMPWTASDPDGDALTYLWSQSPGQPAIFLESPGQSPTTFTTPQVDDDTEFTFTLTVTAGPHNADDSLTITVKNNHSPTVDAGNNRTVNEGVPVTLSGIARDLDDDPLTYEWTIVSGPAPTDLTGDNMESLQFTAPGVAPDEDIVFRFTATDDSGEFAEDTVTITVRDVPITVSSATYNPGSGTLLITFNQDIATVDYSRLHVRSANSDIGGITLFNAVSKDISSNDRTITVVLDSDMKEMYADLTSPHLVVEDGAITDIDGDQTTDVPNQPLRDASSNKRSSSPPPVVHLSALAQARIVDIPAHIAEQISSRDDSDPLEPLMLDDTFDFPLVINGYGYLLDDVTNTLVPQIVTVGDDDPTVITFTVYTQKDLAHFTLYLNLSDENTDYTDSDTYITYKNDGTAVVTDPHGYIADATITVTQEDDSMPEKKTVSITLYFDEPMGPTNMVAYMWNTDRKAAFIKIIDAFEVTAVLPESVIQTADPEPLEPNSELPADPEPSSELPADPEPVSTDTLGPDDYDDAQVLHIIRMWSGFESEFITDEQMLASLGLDYPDADIPDWVMTELGVLAAKGDVTVDEFMLALQYVLENL